MRSDNKRGIQDNDLFREEYREYVRFWGLAKIVSTYDLIKNSVAVN